jgi:AcrR family transcriptional regulator
LTLRTDTSGAKLSEITASWTAGEIALNNLGIGAVVNVRYRCRVKRDRKILLAAQRLFHERGFDAVGMDEVGETAGITGPAIYRHFSGKDELLGTLFDEAVSALLIRVGDQEFDDPWEELAFLAKAHAEFVYEHQELASILIRDDRSLAEPFQRRHRRRERPYIERWIAVLGRCFPDRSEEERTSATFAILHMLNSIGTWPRGARRTENLPDLIADMAYGAAAALGDSGWRELTGAGRPSGEGISAESRSDLVA